MANRNSIIGLSALGLGTIMLIATVNNRQLFGSQGIITQAIETGTIPSLTSSPSAFDVHPGQFPQNPQGVTDANGKTNFFSISDNPSNPQQHSYYQAVVDVSTHNYNLAVVIVNDFVSYQFNPTPALKATCERDISIVQQMGLTDDANSLQAELNAIDAESSPGAMPAITNPSTGLGDYTIR